jgi:hypothetical protein
MHRTVDHVIAMMMLYRRSLSHPVRVIFTRDCRSVASIYKFQPPPPLLRPPFPPRSLSTTAAPAMTTFYDLKAPLPGAKAYDFDQLRGKVVLIVNVASQWCVAWVQHRI